MIPARFPSPAALLLLVTAAALACGLAVNYPQLARELAFVGSFFIPAAIITAALLRISRRRVRMSIVCLASSVGGYMIGTPALAQILFPYLQPVAIIPPGMPIVIWPVVWVVGSLGPTLWVLLFGSFSVVFESRIPSGQPRGT